MHQCYFVWTRTPPLSDQRTPRLVPRVCTCACSSWPGQAGQPPGAFWCASPFLWPFCPSSLFGLLRAGVAPAWFFFVFLWSPFSPRPLSSRAPAVPGVLCFPAIGCPGPWRPFFAPAPPLFCFFLCFPLPSFPLAFPPLLCSAPLLLLAAAFSCFGRGCTRLWRCGVCPFCFPPPPPSCSLCLAVLARAVACRCALCSVCPFLSCCASLALCPRCSAALPVVVRCARVVLLVEFVPFLAPRALVRSCVLRCFLWRLAVWCCAALRGAWCAVLLRAVLCSPASCPVVLWHLLCAAVLCCAGASVSCPCVVRSSSVLLLPACLRFSPLAPTPPWRNTHKAESAQRGKTPQNTSLESAGPQGIRQHPKARHSKQQHQTSDSKQHSTQQHNRGWLFWSVLLCVPLPPRPVPWCAVLCWCACFVLFLWSALFPPPGTMVCCCVLCCCLWCAVARCWVWLFSVVFWWRVSVSVSLSGRVVCFSVVGVVCCGALLPCAVFCGAVLSCGAILSL